MLVDCHTHLLPAMDDGAGDVSMALAMLHRLGEQAVRAVVATPHYRLHTETISSFLARRAIAAEELYAAQMSTDRLPVILGAEVRLERGIASEDLASLCIGGSRHLLLEFPFKPLKSWMLEEVWEIRAAGFVPVLAHVDRYVDWYRPADFAELLALEDCVFQINADAFGRHRAGRLLRAIAASSLPMLFGSDAHNLTTRPPDLTPVSRYLQKSKAGPVMIARMAQTLEDMGI